MGAEVGYLIVYALISTAISYGINYMFRQNQKSPEQPEFGTKVNTRTTKAPLPVVYGEREIAGNIVYIHRASDEYTWLVINVAEGEVEGIKQIDGTDQLFIDGTIYTEYNPGGTLYEKHNPSINYTPTYVDYQRFTLTGSVTGRFKAGRLVTCTLGTSNVQCRILSSNYVASTDLTTVWLTEDSPDLDPTLNNVFVGHNLVEYTFYRGSDTQVYNPFLNAADPNWTDNKRNKAYLVIKIGFDFDILNNLPNISMILEGKKCYNFNTETTEYTRNPIIQLYDYLTNTQYGADIDSSKINAGVGSNFSWTYAANYYDSKSWTQDIILNKEGSSIQDNRDELMNNIRSDMQWYNGVLYLNTRDINEEAVVMNITDEHILQKQNGKAAIQIHEPSRFDSPTAVRVTYTEPNKNWTQDSIIIGDQSGPIFDLKLSGCIVREQAANMGYYTLERLKLNRVLSGTHRDDCMFLMPGDLVNYTTTALGLDSQKMRVVSSTQTESGLCNLSLQWESELLYNDDYDADIDNDTYDCSFPDPNTVSELQSYSLTEETVTDKQRTCQRLMINFEVDPIAGKWFEHCEVWACIDNDSSPETDDYHHMFNSKNDTFINGVNQGDKWYVKLRTVNIWGRKESLDECVTLSYEILGENQPPDSLSYLRVTPGPGGISLYSDVPDGHIDIAWYEIRLGVNFDSAMLLQVKRHPSWNIYNLKPNVYTFSANTLGTNNLYGLEPVTASAEVLVPTNWVYFDEEEFDYSSGTFSLCEQVEITGEKYLEASGSIPSGSVFSWQSDTFDSGVLDKYYTYVLNEVIPETGSQIWNDIPPSASWASIPASASWAQAFQYDFSGTNVKMKIGYKQEVGHDWQWAENAEFASAQVYARYFCLHISGEEEDVLIGTSTLYLYNE